MLLVRDTEKFSQALGFESRDSFSSQQAGSMLRSLCGWQDVRIQLLTNFASCPMGLCLSDVTAVGYAICCWRYENREGAGRTGGRLEERGWGKGGGV